METKWRQKSWMQPMLLVSTFQRKHWWHIAFIIKQHMCLGKEYAVYSSYQWRKWWRSKEKVVVCSHSHAATLLASPNL